MAERKPWPLAKSPDEAALGVLASWLEDNRGCEVGEVEAHSREALLKLMADEGYDVPGFVVQGPEPEDATVLPPAWQGYREWPFAEGIGSVDLAELRGFLDQLGVPVGEADASSRRGLLDLLAGQGFAPPGYVPGEDAALEETMQRRGPDYQDPGGDIADRQAENRAEFAHRTAVEEALGEVPPANGQILLPWPFGTLEPGEVPLAGLRDFLGARGLSYSMGEDRPDLLSTLAWHGYQAGPEPGDGHRWPFMSGPQDVPLGSVRVWLARQGGAAQDLAENLAARPDRPGHLAALRECGVQFPGNPEPVTGWPFFHGPQFVPLVTVRSWLAAQDSFQAGRADALEAVPEDRSRHLRALREAGVEFPAEPPPELDDPGVDLPGFVTTLMEATGEQLDEAIHEIGPAGRGRLLRALSGKPQAGFCQDEAQVIIDDAKAAWPPFVMGQAGSGKSRYTDHIAAETAALAAEHGPDTGDWSVEVVTRHHFRGVTAEHASVEAVRQARGGSGEVREVLARRESRTS